MDITAAHLDVAKSDFDRQVKILAAHYSMDMSDVNIQFGKTWRGSRDAPHIQLVSRQINLSEMAAFGLAVSEQFKSGLSVGNCDTAYYDGVMFTRNRADVVRLQTDKQEQKKFFKSIKEAEKYQGRQYSAREDESDEDRRELEQGAQNRQARQDRFNKSMASQQEMLQRNNLVDLYGPAGLHHRDDCNL